MRLPSYMLAFDINFDLVAKALEYAICDHTSQTNSSTFFGCLLRAAVLPLFVGVAGLRCARSCMAEVLAGAAAGAEVLACAAVPAEAISS